MKTGGSVAWSEPQALGQIKISSRPAPWSGAVWCLLDVDPEIADGVAFNCRPGTLVEMRRLWFDILLDANWFVTFQAVLWAGNAPLSTTQFSPLTQCQVRIVIPLDGIDLTYADRLVVSVIRKTAVPASFCLGPVLVGTHDPQKLADPLLPRGPLLDEMGQSTLHDWPGKTRSVLQLVTHLRHLHDDVVLHRPPDSFTRWGGWVDRRIEASGFFRTYHDGRRWWLVDPDGHLFWSTGTDCVHPTIDHETRYETGVANFRNALAWMPDSTGPFADIYHTNPYHDPRDREINYLAANFLRAFGPVQWREAWGTIAFAELRRLGFNTAGNWSDEAACSTRRVAYVRPLDLAWRFPSVIPVAGNFPDVFDPNLVRDAAAYAEALRPTVNDPAMIGYFLTNEPNWAWQSDVNTPLAATMLRQTPSCHTRRALTSYLKTRYSADTNLAAAWGPGATFDAVAEGPWASAFSDAALADLRAFSTIMLEMLLRLMSDATHNVDPNHLNLGIRWGTFPPCWALEAMGSCDVVSFNYYEPMIDLVGYGQPRERQAHKVLAKLHRPVLIGEWHFGSLDVGLPSAGLRRVADQEERGKAYRVYVEHAASLPWCVGTHWFNLYDRNALYCASSNENYNIGFLDLCHIRYEPLCLAARLTHERLYAVASGLLPPHNEPVKHQFPSR